MLPKKLQKAIEKLAKENNLNFSFECLYCGHNEETGVEPNPETHYFVTFIEKSEKQKISEEGKLVDELHKKVLRNKKYEKLTNSL